MPGPLTDAYALVVVASFLLGAVLDASGNRRAGRFVTVAAWVVFAGFWAVLVPHFAFDQLSIVQGLLSAVAVPASVYVGYLLYRGRDTLMTLSRGVAVMGLVYLPFHVFDSLTRPLIMSVVAQVEFVLAVLGYEPTLVEGSRIGAELGIANAFLFVRGDAGFSTEVVLACTGLGSIAIFAGLVAAVDAPTRRRLLALGIAAPVIYGLNTVRVTFITLAHGQQWFQGSAIEGPIMTLFGTTNPNRVSYLLADRVLAQSMSVVALVILALLMVRILPELMDVFEDVLFVVTGNEYDLSDALDADSTGGEDGPMADD